MSVELVRPSNFYVGLAALELSAMQAVAAAGKFKRLNFWPFVRSKDTVAQWWRAILMALFGIFWIVSAL